MSYIAVNQVTGRHCCLTIDSKMHWYVAEEKAAKSTVAYQRTEQHTAVLPNRWKGTHFDAVSCDTQQPALSFCKERQQEEHYQVKGNKGA